MGRYRLVGLLATGGMAEVYLALSGELSGFRTLVVVKRILPHLSSNHEFVDMFFDEARIAARLDHPNIARIIEVGHEGDEYFLAIEVVQGRSLSAVLRRARRAPQSPISHAQSAYIVAQAAKGLGYAHALTDADGNPMNVVHRDVSPQNILVSFGGAVKVIDFGVARAYGRVTETVPGGLKGKIQYMSPEQVRAKGIDCRSDVYALGIVLWEALCGRRLYHRATEMETMQAIVDEPVTPPSMIVPTSARLERIVMQALEKDPAKRFQNGSEMALALERHAFASDSFNPLQVSTSMKKLFATDYARWTRTVASATDLEGPPEAWSNTAGTYLNPASIDLGDHGPRLVPRDDSETPTKADDPANDSRSVTTAVTSPDELTDSLPPTPSPIRTPPPLRPVPTARIVHASARHMRVSIAVTIVCAAIAVGLSIFTLVHTERIVVVPAPPPTAPVARGVPKIRSARGPPRLDGRVAVAGPRGRVSQTRRPAPRRRRRRPPPPSCRSHRTQRPSPPPPPALPRQRPRRSNPRPPNRRSRAPPRPRRPLPRRRPRPRAAAAAATPPASRRTPAPATPRRRRRRPRPPRRPPHPSPTSPRPSAPATPAAPSCWAPSPGPRSGSTARTPAPTPPTPSRSPAAPTS